MEINITVPGEPVPQGRPKFTTIGGHARAYDPKKSVDYKKLVARYAMQHKPATLLDGALEVQISIFKPMLKGFSKRKAEQAEARLIRPTTKPDADNYAKGPIDALKDIIWKDDGQVVDLVARKFYSENPRIEITVRTLDNQQIELIYGEMNMVEKKVYNSWAFTENQREKGKMNFEIYKELTADHKVSRRDFKNESNLDDFDIVIVRQPGYKSSTYRILKNDSELSTDELLLLCDGGNLCFGGRRESSDTFVVWED